MKMLGGPLNVYIQVDEATQKRLNIVWFQIDDILEKPKLGTE
jgi:hypothetical protein